jgi:GNAT superfamily N-acetyltransferase
VSYEVIVRPATPGRWSDLEKLFGPSGAYSGCWCMFFRQTSAEFQAKAGNANRTELHGLVAGKKVPGLLAYRDKEPVGWVSVAPRTQFGRIERSPLFKRDEPEPNVWSIVCFYVGREHRGEGVASALVRGAVEYAVSKGATAVEGYPRDKPDDWKTAENYLGTRAMFESCGFKEIARPKPARPLMRYSV